MLHTGKGMVKRLLFLKGPCGSPDADTVVDVSEPVGGWDRDLHGFETEMLSTLTSSPLT